MKKFLVPLLTVAVIAAIFLSGCVGGAAPEAPPTAPPTAPGAPAGAPASDAAKAQQYKNANPGDSFLIGHITFHLSREYAMMYYQADEQACKQLGLQFQGALAS